MGRGSGSATTATLPSGKRQRAVDANKRCIIQGCSRIVTGPPGRVRRFPKSRGWSPVWSRGVRNVTRWVGSGQEVFKPRGSGQITLIRPDPREAIRPAKSPGVGNVIKGGVFGLWFYDYFRVVAFGVVH